MPTVRWDHQVFIPTACFFFGVFASSLVEAYHSVESANIKNAGVRLLSRLHSEALCSAFEMTNSLQWMVNVFIGVFSY